MKEYDIAIIGGGPAGYVAAIRASQLGASAVLIEKDALGGTCLNRGCIPTKALLHHVGILESINKAKDIGITVGEVIVDFAKMMAGKNTLVRTLAANVRSLVKSHKVEILKGTARVISPTEVAITGGETENVRCKKMILAPGSVPSGLSIPGADGSAMITSDDILQLTEIPRRLVIIGGGVIGVEFATIFARLGADVTIVEMFPRIIPHEDHEVSRSLKRILEKDGIKIITDAQVNGIENDAGGNKRISVTVRGDEQQLTSELVLAAVGRKPNIEGLDLDRLGIKTEGGKIVVNNKMETSVSGIYAAGDAIGGILLAHVASAEGEVAAENAMGKDTVMDYNVVPHCIYTFPEVASIGITEHQAKEKGLAFKIGKFPFMANPKATIAGHRDGFVKVLCDVDTDHILGIHIFGHQATELISETALAMKLNASVADVFETIHAHPSLSEAIREAFLNVKGMTIHMPKGF